MPRKPLPMKPWHLYEFVPYIAAKVFGSCVNPKSYTTYGKTKRDAMETFRTNHTGHFVLVSDSAEIPVIIYDNGTWLEDTQAALRIQQA